MSNGSDDDSVETDEVGLDSSVAADDHSLTA